MFPRKRQSLLSSYFDQISKKSLIDSTKHDEGTSASMSTQPLADFSATEPDKNTNCSNIDVLQTTSTDIATSSDAILLNERDPCHDPLFSRKIINSGPYQPDKLNFPIKVLECFRSDVFFKKIWDHCTQLTQKCDFKPEELPRKRTVPSKKGGGSKVVLETETVEQHYKWIILYPLIDILVEEIRNKFSENCLDILKHLHIVLNANEVNRLIVESSSNYYNLNKMLVIAELQCFYRMDSITGKNIEKRATVCAEKKLKEVFPLIFELFRLYYTIPMNSATSERSFSSLRRLKTYCRSTTGQERLSSLALLAIEHNVSVDIDKIKNVFDRSKKRRLQLS